MRSVIGICLIVSLGAGCATQIARPASDPKPAKVKFSEFKTVAMKHVTINPPYDKAAANQKAARKIDEELFKKMRVVYPSLQDADKPADAAQSAGRTLLIEPTVKEVKFVGGFARFMVGAMAGSSAVLMKVSFKDKATGEVIADPEFFSKAGAMSGGYSMGGTDNAMLSQIAQDICNYVTLSR